MDILWTGEFDLTRGRNWGSDSVDTFVKKTAKLLGYDKENMEIKDAVKFLEEKFPINLFGNHSENCVHSIYFQNIDRKQG